TWCSFRMSLQDRRRPLGQLAARWPDRSTRSRETSGSRRDMGADEVGLTPRRRLIAVAFRELEALIVRKLAMSAARSPISDCPKPRFRRGLIDPVGLSGSESLPAQ